MHSYILFLGRQTLAGLFCVLPIAALSQTPRRDSIPRLDTVRVREAHVAETTPAVTRSATRIPTRIVNLPMSLTVLSRARLEEQAMRSLGDALRYVPGATMGQGEGHRDQPTLRGISSTADLYVDGVRDDAQYLRDAYNVERIEAVRGANALAFGRGGGGGVLNRVLRRADFGTHRALSLAGGSFEQARGTVDLGGAIGSRLAVRLNGVGESGDSFRGIGLRRSGVTPTAAMVVGGGLLDASAEHFEDRRTVDRGLPSFGRAPAPVPTSTFYGDRALNRSRAVVNHARLQYERTAASTFDWRTVLAWSQYDKMYQNLVPGAMNADGSAVILSAYRNDTDRRNLIHQTDLSWRARRGATEHVVLFGVETGIQATDNFRETGYFAGGATSVTVPAGGGGTLPAVSFRQSATDADNATRATVAAVHAQHLGTWGRAWQTTLGVRVERIGIAFENYRTGATLDRSDVMVSPRAGLVFKPVANGSLYASLATTALPSAGDQFASLTAATAALEPERFETREVGAKWEPTPRLRISGAAYVLTRSRSSAPDPQRAGALVQTGKQESRGVELEAEGDIVPGWSVVGAFTRQRARIVSRTSTALAGTTVPLVPAQSMALWNRVQIGRRVDAAIGIVRQARMYAAVDNTVELPAFTRLDAALFATLGARMSAQVNVENLANARYFATANSNNNLQPGSPRTLKASLTLR
jgi:catecholate siderophore receptor